MAESALSPQTTEPQIAADQHILGGMPVIAGTRVPAATILACLQDGMSEADILEDYPSITRDGIKAVWKWAALLNDMPVAAPRSTI